MASESFVQRIKTEMNILNDNFDQRISDVADEALLFLNRFKETEVDEDTIDALDKRVIFLYLKIHVSGEADLTDALNQTLELVREQ